MKQRDVNFIKRHKEKGTPYGKVYRFLSPNYSDEEIAKFMKESDFGGKLAKKATAKTPPKTKAEKKVDAAETKDE